MSVAFVKEIEWPDKPIMDAEQQRIGLMSGGRWRDDPKGLLFTLSRYKQVAKLLEDKFHVLEVGCGDGFGTRIVRQHVAAVTAIDRDPHMVADAKSRDYLYLHIDFECRDFLEDPPDKKFDAVYALDVFEHIEKDRAPLFLGHMAGCAPIGIIGSPSLESQPYASPRSKAGHVNCRTAADLKLMMGVWYKHVFMFGMQDEALHTGYDKMRHYHLALGVN